MKKIRLDADDLEVLSFATAPLPQVRGTVEAADTGNPCYDTVAYHDTVCVGYPASYWGEDTCDWPPRAVHAGSPLPAPPVGRRHLHHVPARARLLTIRIGPPMHPHRGVDRFA